MCSYQVFDQHYFHIIFGMSSCLNELKHREEREAKFDKSVYEPRNSSFTLTLLIVLNSIYFIRDMILTLIPCV